MHEDRPYLLIWRGLMVAGFLALVAGCLPETRRVASIPANLAANGGVGEITLTWDASAGATGYSVKRSTASTGPYAPIASTSAPTYTDSGVTGGTVYFYVVSSLAPDGESGVSAPASAATVVPPPVPGNVTATAGDGQASLAWSASSGATGYRIKRATISGGPYTQIAESTSTSHIDTALTNGTMYFYVVSAFNLAGESGDSLQSSTIPDIQNPPPTVFGTWTNVTPEGVDLTSELCSNYGAKTVHANPARPSDLYVLFDCQGIWRSRDYGASWTGPINTGTNGNAVRDCSGGIAIPPSNPTDTPVIYASCVRGSAVGAWKSLDGGTSWIRLTVVHGGANQSYDTPVVDPHDPDHVLMMGHEFASRANYLVETVDGGQNWSSVPIADGMFQAGRSPAIFFIDTGVPSSTRGTWLWIGDAAGGAHGTWRTANGGAAWNRVDSNEHTAPTQIYQPDTNGVVYMTGAYSALGWGVLRSRDYGVTWTHVGIDNIQSAVFGTSKNVYGMAGGPVGPGGTISPNFQVAAQPGTGRWVAPGTPAELTQGPGQVVVVNDGTSNILVGAMWNKGIWRYIEP